MLLQEKPHRHIIGKGNSTMIFIMVPMPGFLSMKAAGPCLVYASRTPEDSSGVKVLDVDDGSLADNAGIRENDIITQIDGKQVKDTDDAREALIRNKREKPIQCKPEKEWYADDHAGENTS